MSVLVISGPTGSGKTQLALDMGIAPIFNADAFQFYKEIPVFSNQPTSGHEKFKFLAHRSISNPTNAGEFGREAGKFLQEKGVWVGVGLYVGALLYGLDEKPVKGTPFQGAPKVPYKMIVLNPPRDRLYESLNKRVDEMLKAGAIDEAKFIFKMISEGKLERANPVVKAIGLNHILQFLFEEISYERAIELWKRDTRRLAKRQMTWLRGFCAPSEEILWVDPKKVTPSEANRFF